MLVKVNFLKHNGEVGQANGSRLYLVKTKVNILEDDEWLDSFQGQKSVPRFLSFTLDQNIKKKEGKKREAKKIKKAF